MAVKLRSHLDKYLVADDDRKTVRQTRNGSSKKAKWFIELVQGKDNIIHLKTCEGRYLTASETPFLLGMTGKKIIQTEQENPKELNIEWEPLRDGFQVKLKSWCGKFLRANGGTPPWRNSVTHDEPHTGTTQNWILWDVEAVEANSEDCLTENLSSMSSFSSVVVDDASDGCFESEPGSPVYVASPTVKTLRLTMTLVKSVSSRLSPKKSTDSNVNSPPKVEGRTIFYHVVDDGGEVDDDVVEGSSLIFKGKGVEELTQKLREDTGFEDIIVCTRSPLNGKLHPLKLQPPPNNANMHVVVVPASSRVARDMAKQGLAL